jgi:hypothetical protein
MMVYWCCSAGESYFVTFQKNLNHFDVSHPGYFAISFLANITEDGMCNDAVLLAKVPDTSDPSLTLYTVKVIMPTTPTDHGVLQVHSAKYLISILLFNMYCMCRLFIQQTTLKLHQTSTSVLTSNLCWLSANHQTDYGGWGEEGEGVIRQRR